MTRLDTWNQLQANGLKAYREIPEASCALACRRDVKAFKRFIGKQDGDVLDIGCGIEVPGYLDKHNLRRTIGIDPLPAKVEDFWPMLRYIASGEALPYHDQWENLFDLVLLAGTLDHVLDPAQVLSEACRVVKPSGRIVVQIGIPASDPRPLIRRIVDGFVRAIDRAAREEFVQDFVKSLPVPAGAVDPFHFKYYTEPEIEALFAAAKLNISRVKRIPGSTFYELRK